LGGGKVFSESLTKIISALNAAESINFENESYTLLSCFESCPIDRKCKDMVQALLDKNQYKQNQVKNITKEIERRISQKHDEPIIFEGDPSWKLTLAGSVASTICTKYEKPVFIFKKMDKESCGSVRNPKGTNSVDAMKECDAFLLTYGGHAMASGFRIKNEYLDKFKDCLSNFFKKNKK